jgi:ribosome biogenesis GTPase
LEAIASDCKYADCSHRSDAGCAIRAAVDSGQLDAGRHESFLNLETEIAALKKRAEKRQMAVERWAKRSHRVKARNLNDRIQLERDERGDV